MWQSHPPVGVYIAGLGVLGVFLTFVWERLDRERKTIATGLLFLLLLLEIKSMVQDSNEQQAKFKDTLTRIEDLMSEATGGDSHIYFTVPQPIMGPIEITVPGIAAKGYVVAPAILQFVGKFPLHDVIVSADCPMAGWLGSVDYGTVFPDEIGRPRQQINLQFPPTISERDLNCFLFITTSNGSYSQIFHFLREDDRWAWGSVLGKYGQQEFKHEFFGAGFPKDYKW